MSDQADSEFRAAFAFIGHADELEKRDSCLLRGVTFPKGETVVVTDPLLAAKCKGMPNFQSRPLPGATPAPAPAAKAEHKAKELAKEPAIVARTFSGP